jgi:hypothetical protein
VAVLTAAACAHDGHPVSPNRLELRLTPYGLAGMLTAANDQLAAAMARGHDAAWQDPHWFECRYELVEKFLEERVRLEADGVRMSVQGRTLHGQEFETELELGVVWETRKKALRIDCMVVPYMGRTLVTLEDGATGSIQSATLSPLSPASSFALPEPVVSRPEDAAGPAAGPEPGGQSRAGAGGALFALAALLAAGLLVRRLPHRPSPAASRTAPSSHGCAR